MPSQDLFILNLCNNAINELTKMMKNLFLKDINNCIFHIPYPDTMKINFDVLYNNISSDSPIPNFNMNNYQENLANEIATCIDFNFINNNFHIFNTITLFYLFNIACYFCRF